MATRLRSPAAALLGALLCALATVAVGCVAYLVPSAQHLDAVALHGFNTLEGGLLKRPAVAIASLGAPLAIVPGLPLLWFAASHWGRRREGLVGIAVVLASSATAEVVKIATAQERFQSVLGPHQVNPASFPSGTVAAVMAFVVAALIVVPNRLRVRTAIAGAVAVAVVAFAVMVSLWHFPSDVLGGILVPTGFGFLGVAVLRYLRSPRGLGRPAPVPRPSPRILETGAAVLVGGAILAVLVLGDRLFHYADRYTTTVIAALAISAFAAALLTLFGLAAVDDS